MNGNIRNEIAGVIRTNGISGYWGLRALCSDEDYVAGDEPRESYDWDHEQDISTFHTDGSTVGGVSTVGITLAFEEDLEQDIETALRMVGNYEGHRVALIHADGCEHGEDDGEFILMGNAEVMGVWDNAEEVE